MRATIRNAFFFRPLALALALAMLPPDITGISFGQRAQAAPTVNIPAGCAQLGGAHLIQMVCTADGSDPTFDLLDAVRQFESDSIKLYLGTLGASNTDADVAFVYQYARSDLRSQIRGFMQVRLIDITLRSKDTWTANENAIYQWISHRLAYHEKQLYRNALKDFNAWADNHCVWSPDKDVAAAYGLHYIPCVGAVVANNAPSEGYYLSAARKREYEELLANLKSIAPQRNSSGWVNTSGTPSGYTMFSMSSRDAAAIGGSLAAAVGLVGGSMGLSQIAQIKKILFPKSYFKGQQLKADTPSEIAEDLTKLAPRVATQAATEADTAATDAATNVATQVGAELGVTFALDEIEAQNEIKKALTDLVTEYGQIASSDLSSYYITEEGRYKIQVIWTEAYYPDAPSIAPLPAPDTTPKLIRIPYGKTFPDWSGAV